MLTSGWDQNGFTGVLSPAARAAEAAAGAWVKELLGIPATASCGFVTGTQEANTIGLAAGRHHVLAAAGWDVARDGLNGAPRVRVVANAERHATIDRSLRLLGFGDAHLELVDTDDNGAIDVDGAAAGARRRAGRAGHRVPAVRQREHRRLRRPARRVRRRARGGRVGARGRRVRALGLGQPGAPAPQRRHRAGRLVEHRRPQVAERAVRRGVRAGVPPRRALGRDVVHRAVPDDLDRRPGAGRPGPQLVAPGARVHDLGGHPGARPVRRRRPRRPVLLAGEAVRGRPRGRRPRDRQRRGAEPGAGRVR